VPWSLRALLAALVLGVLTSPAAAQLQLAVVRGTVLDESGLAMAGSTIDLTDPLGATINTTDADASGKFVFNSVAPGRYQVRARIAGFEPTTHPLDVTSALPVELTLRMTLRTSISEVIIQEGMEPNSPSSRASIAGESIARIPARTIAGGVQEAVATLPGWATEDNGLLHVRGIDDGFLYVIDGVPVYERLDPLNGMGPPLANIESINVITGYIPAEFGYKAGGVIDVRSKSIGQDWLGTVQIERGSDNAVAASALAAWRFSPVLAITVVANGQRSDRFLDPIHPDNFHNHGALSGAEGQLMWSASDTDVVIANAAFGAMDYDVPNNDLQETASQDQRQQIRRRFATLSWQHGFSSSTFSQLAAYARRSKAALAGSAADTPLFAEADRRLFRSGVIAGLSRRIGSSMIKSGFELQRLSLDESFGFAVTDPELAADAGFSGAALEYTVDRPFVFAESASPLLWSAFLQDEWAASDALTVSGGVRFDVSHLGKHYQQLSPRLGATYRAARTVLRGSISRFFQPPQPENFLLSSSEEARGLSPFAAEGGSGGADLEPERQWMFEAGVNHQFASRTRLDAAVWRRTITNAADPNVFAGTTIIFPNAVARGRAAGIDLRVELPRRASWSGYLNLSIGRVRQNGPITGGLFLEDDIADIASGEEFVPDHDQLVVGGGGVTWTPGARATVSATFRYESGTPIQQSDDDLDELGERPGAEMVDFDAGRVKGRAIASILADAVVWKRGRQSATVRGTVMNIFDRRYAYNFGNPFSGTHFGAPRTASLSLRLAF
jgi:outer membrane receptor for ferrienterochelin and colicin